MELYLVQHAESKLKEEDPEKTLTDEGVASARRISDWAAQAGIAVEEVRHSGKTRAEQTAAILAEGLARKVDVKAVPGIDPLDDPAPLADELRLQQFSLMVVGHLPFLSRLAGTLLAGDPESSVVAFENAGIVCLRRSNGLWSVSWAMVPRLLNSS